MAKRYIDADLLEKTLQEIAKEPDYQHEGEDWRTGLCIAEQAVNDTPTADVVEVVRCRDCKHATFYSCKNDAGYQGIICEYRIAIGDRNFFCSCGERRAEQ